MQGKNNVLSNAVSPHMVFTCTGGRNSDLPHMSILIDLHNIHISKSVDGEDGRVVREFDPQAMQVVLLGALQSDFTPFFHLHGQRDCAAFINAYCVGIIGMRHSR